MPNTLPVAIFSLDVYNPLYAKLVIKGTERKGLPTDSVFLPISLIEGSLVVGNSSPILSLLSSSVQNTYDMTTLEEEVMENLPNVIAQFHDDKVRKAKRNFMAAMKNFTEYFNPKFATELADRISHMIHFRATIAEREGISNAVLYSYDGIYVPDGEARVAMHLARIRDGMLRVLVILGKEYRPVIETNIQKLKEQKETEETAEKIDLILSTTSVLMFRVISNFGVVIKDNISTDR